MCWLTYADDEVGRFHPEFEDAANEALRNAGLEQRYEWKHHLRTASNPLVPDFVLRSREDRVWLLTLEIKRRREAVYSTRNQIQAKAYAEVNQNRYIASAPKYFAISNLESTILFALSDSHPPKECRLQNGTFHSGDFYSDSAADHKQTFIRDISTVVATVTSGSPPAFDLVWPAVISDFIGYTNSLPCVPEIAVDEPRSEDWPVVRSYFAGAPDLDSCRIFLLRCLMLEYLRGTLIRHGHDGADALPPLQADRPKSSVANAIDAIRQIDFRNMFRDSESLIYRNLSDSSLIQVLTDYIQGMKAAGRDIADLALKRVDSLELLDSLVTAIYPVEIQDECGKVPTDPELAAILAYAAIARNDSNVVDPCCGDGVLLSAAYDRMTAQGAVHSSVLANLSGIEADPIACRLASVRLALKRPAVVSPEPSISLICGDMFADTDKIAGADVVLMNPPFKRYEALDERPIPPELRAHYDRAIEQLDGLPASTTGGQANLYCHYVEFVGKSMSAGATLAVILDNKWFQKKSCTGLKSFLLGGFEILALVAYPHSVFFQSWDITTSLVIARKVENVGHNHKVWFLRCKTDPRSVDLNALGRAYHDGGEWPRDWICQSKLQRELRANEGWKRYFAKGLVNDFRFDDWPTMSTLFQSSRRGSLEKEGGGIGVLEFPFSRSQYGPRRRVEPPPRRRFQTRRGRALTAAENRRLARLAGEIPSAFRGWALRKADDIDHYELTRDDVEKQETLEPPTLRARYNLYRNGRTEWTPAHDSALVELRGHPQVGAFLRQIERIVNLNEAVLPKEELWNVLREPVAGELIVPRKTRQGHRVHINSFALEPGSRQVRISSNFISYAGCRAINHASGLNSRTSVILIAAFLMSSFGQLQFEMEGNNREGVLALEKEHLSRIRILDPRWIAPGNRSAIVDAFRNLPYPILTTALSVSQPERNQLDILVAQEIVNRHSEFEVQTLLDEVHASLDEWLQARQP